MATANASSAAARPPNWWQKNAIRVATEYRRFEHSASGIVLQHKRFLEEEQKRSASIDKIKKTRVGRSAKDLKTMELEAAVDDDATASRSKIDAGLALQRLAELERAQLAAQPDEPQDEARARARKIQDEKAAYCNAIRSVRNVRNALRHPERTPSTLERLRKVTSLFTTISVKREASRRRSSKADMLSHELDGPLHEFDHYTPTKPQFRVALFVGALVARTAKSKSQIKVSPRAAVKTGSRKSR